MNHNKILSIAVFIGVLITASGFQTSPEYKILFEKARFTMETKGDLNGAISLFNDIIKKYPKEREYAAKSQLYIGLCYEKLGVKEAQKAYQKVVNSYPEQTETVKLANEKLSLLLKTENVATNKEMILRRVWANPVTSGEGGPSPDGRYISFTDWETGDLAIHDLITGENRRLTNKISWSASSESAGYSCFSPDGKKIAYAWLIWDKSQTELRIIDTNDSQQKIIYKGDDSWPVGWSPDGKFILLKLLNKDRTWRPAIIAIKDGSVQELAFQMPGMMCYSPDGGYIAYDAPQEKDSSQHDIYLFDLATKQIVTLVKHPSDDILLGWSPDGRNLLFTSTRSGTRDAWLLDISGGQPHGEPGLIRKNIGEVVGVGFTRSGTYYFQVSVDGNNIYTAKVDFNSGKVLSPPLEATGSHLGSNWRPDFSSDGNLMAYISKRTSGTEKEGVIVVRSLETGTERILKPFLDLGFALKWFPDGRSLLVNGTDYSKKEGVFRIDIQTGKASMIKERHFIGVPGLEITPDGNKIFYSAVAGSGIPVGEEAYDVRHFVLDLKTNQEQELIRPRNTPLVPLALSPDGEQLAFIGTGNNTGTTGICVIPSKGGHQTLLTDIGSPGWASRVIDWTPDGRYLVYAKILPKTHDTNLGQTSWELWRISSQGGEPQRIGLTVNGLLRHLSIHPDGQRILYYTWRGSTEIWAMENFLPKEKIEANNQLTLRKLENDVLNTPYARLSPDGKKIAYQVYTGGSPKRFDMLDLNSGTSKVLLDGTAGDPSYLAWSPQSDKIAYTFHGRELYIQNINGTNSQLILESQVYKFYPFEWSRDGKKILCFLEGDDRKVRIGTVTLNGQIQVLESSASINSGFISEPRISPDGRYIAGSLGARGGNTDIYVWTADDSRKVQVTTHPGRDENPVWSPDGKFLIFLSDKNRSADLWGVQMKDGATVGAPFIIKQDLGWRTGIMDLTVTGKLFLFMLGGVEPANLYTIPVNQKSGNLNGTIAPVSVYPTAHSFPRYSPDSKMIAYLSRRGEIGIPKLFVMDEKGAEKEIPLQGHYIVNMVWHPAGQSLIFAGWDKTSNAGIFEISVEKGEIKSIYSGEKVDLKAHKGGLGNINMLPEAGKIMFFRGMGNGDDLITCEPDGQNLNVVLRQVKMPFWGLPSPTGKNICYRTGDSLKIVSVPDGDTKYVGSSTPNLEATWSPKGESLMFREGSSLRVYSVKEKSARTLYKAPSGKTIGGMEMYANIWSPDGNRVIITVQDTSAASVSPQKLIMINPADGLSSVLGEAPKGYRLRELRWSPDGSKVMATCNSIVNTRVPTYEYWVMENFLPK